MSLTWSHRVTIPAGTRAEERSTEDSSTVSNEPTLMPDKPQASTLPNAGYLTCPSADLVPEPELSQA